ncbi:MAG: DMT family transporter [Candidatus Obscuribacterales bacterium]|nr:DMT family transporter [Candidatus Obscuribacterales bacterium]
MAFSTAEILTFQIALTIFAWGLWGIFDKLALSRAEPKDVFLVTAILAIPQIPLVLFLLTWNYEQWHLSSSLIIYASASSVISSLGMALYLDSMKRADSSVVLGMTAAYPLVTQVLGLLIMGETFSTSRAIGAVFIALGIVVIGLTDNLSPMLWQPSTALPPEENEEHSTAAKQRKKEEKEKNVGSFTGMPVIVTLLLVNLLWGCKGILEKLSLEHGKPLEVYLAETITTLILLGPVLTFFIWRGYKPALKNKHLWKYTGLSELSLAIGGWSYLMALSMAPAGYVVTITSTYPLVMYVIAIFVLKEKLSLMRLAGLACIVGGGMMV